MRDASTSQFDLNRKTWMSSRNGEKCITSTRQQHIGAADTRTWPRETQGSSNGIQALHEVLCRGQLEPSGQCQGPLGRERPEDFIDACFDDFYSVWLLNTACRIAQKPLCSCEFYRRQCDVMRSFCTYTCFHSINIFLMCFFAYFIEPVYIKWVMGLHVKFNPFASKSTIYFILLFLSLIHFDMVFTMSSAVPIFLHCTSFKIV